MNILLRIAIGVALVTMALTFILARTNVSIGLVMGLYTTEKIAIVLAIVLYIWRYVSKQRRRLA